MSGPQIALEVVFIAVAAVIQGVSGFGFGLVSIPLLAAVGGLDQAVTVSAVLGLVSSFTIGATARHEVRRATVGALLTGAVVGLPVGTAVLLTTPTRGLSVAVGVIILVTTAALATGITPPVPGRGVLGALGATSAALGVCTGLSGPPVVIGLRSAGVAAGRRATTAVTLGAIGVAVVTIRAVTGHLPASGLAVSAIGLPASLAGNAAGRRLFARMGDHHYDWAVTALLAASGIVAIVRA